jgi:hypothetical protein
MPLHICEPLATHLVNWRREHNLNLEQLKFRIREKTGTKVSYSTLARFERGVPILEATWHLIAQVCGYPVLAKLETKAVQQ